MNSEGRKWLMEELSIIMQKWLMTERARPWPPGGGEAGEDLFGFSGSASSDNSFSGRKKNKKRACVSSHGLIIGRETAT